MKRGPIIVLLLVSLSAQANTCRVVSVADGDTLTALSAGNVEKKIRIAEIDAPEKKQPFGQQATITPQTRDRYGHTVARVECQGKDVSIEPVLAGMEWSYDEYVADRALYTLQDEARSKMNGVWASYEKAPLWAWRA